MKNFVSRYLRGRAEGMAPVQPNLPEGRRVYSIGDIHGQAHLLEELHARIEADAAGFEGRKTVVYLGDFIDRGERSKDVVDILLQPLAGFEVVHLMGNHEKTLLDFLRYPHAVTNWFAYGGRATVYSYGVSMRFEPSAAEIEQVCDDLKEAIPPRHLEFFQALKPFHVAGSYGFVHAGIRPGIPLQAQREDDLYWIREDFTESRAPHELVIVHGHSQTREVAWRPNRIGIDTGAYHSGILTCLVLEGTTQRLLQTGTGS